jgi:hypothetical protein
VLATYAIVAWALRKLLVYAITKTDGKLQDFLKAAYIIASIVVAVGGGNLYSINSALAGVNAYTNTLTAETAYLDKQLEPIRAELARLEKLNEDTSTPESVKLERSLEVVNMFSDPSEGLLTEEELFSIQIQPEYLNVLNSSYADLVLKLPSISDTILESESLFEED